MGAITLPADLEAAAEASATPAAVRLLFERLAGDGVPGALERLAGEPGLAATVSLVAGASRSLARLILTDGEALEVLADVTAAVAGGGQARTAEPSSRPFRRR